jgi:hemerythrin
MVYTFTKDLETGNDKIDTEHKKLIAAANAMFDACAAGKGRAYLNEAMKFLVDYTGTHFANEEKLQLSVKYPDYPNHKKLHEEFKRTCADLAAKISLEGATISNVGALNSAIGGWLLNHIRREDTKLGKYIEAAKAK